MSVYQVILVPDSILRGKSLPVKNINAGVLRVIENMVDTMYAFDGVGLAAPQIGVSKRIIVVDPGEELIVLVNPEITYQEGSVVGNEACLSVPDTDGLVNRAEKVIVKGLDKEGTEVLYEAEGALARIFQHEIDHLNGIIFTDLAEKLRKKR